MSRISLSKAIVEFVYAQKGDVSLDQIVGHAGHLVAGMSAVRAFDRSVAWKREAKGISLDRIRVHHSLEDKIRKGRRLVVYNAASCLVKRGVLILAGAKLYRPGKPARNMQTLTVKVRKLFQERKRLSLDEVVAELGQYVSQQDALEGFEREFRRGRKTEASEEEKILLGTRFRVRRAVMSLKASNGRIPWIRSVGRGVYELNEEDPLRNGKEAKSREDDSEENGTPS